MKIDGFIKDHDSGKYVLDYQLIYHTDSRINLDFYADGIRFYLKGLMPWIRPQRPAYGMLILNSNEYKACSIIHRVTSSVLPAVWKQTASMVKSIGVLRSATYDYEEIIKSGLPNFFSFDNYYQSIIKCMSWKSLSDSIEPWKYYSTQGAYIESISSLRAYSHAGAFARGLIRLGPNPSETAIQRFIENFGFLGDFTIVEKEAEKPDRVLELASRSVVVNPSRGKRGAGSLADILAKRIMFYEEHRHYLQMRALRNFRRLFLAVGLDPQTAVAQDLRLGLKA